MYLDFLVKVPTVKGKITRRKKSNVVYILCDRPILPWRGPFNRHCRITGHERFDGKADERADQGFRVFLF